MRRPLAALALLSLAIAAPATAQEVRTYTSGLEHPWELRFLPEGGALVTERPGRVRLLRSDGAIAATVHRDAVAGGEGGMLGLELDPDFASNRLVYLYRTLGSPLENQVVRFRFPRGGAFTDGQVVVEDIPASSIHNGGRLRMGPDGWLYITTGDAADTSVAQRPLDPADPDTRGGKILRLPPAGYRGTGAGLEQVSLGHRNPQGIDWQPGTGTMYEDEHGPTGEDEVNLIVMGGNYGWPDRRGANHSGFRAPLALYNPAIAPSGATFVRTPGSTWTGDYLIAALRGQQIRRLRFEGERVTVNEPLFAGAFGRLRSVVEGPDGALYVLTSNGDDVIRRIVPPAGPATPGTGGTGGGGTGAGGGGAGGGAALGVLARQGRGTPISQYGGVLAFSAYDARTRRYRLMIRRAGARAERLPVPSHGRPFDVDLGPGPRGGIAAVYSRCRRGCDVYRFTLGGRRELRLRRRGSERLPSIWRGRIAFARGSRVHIGSRRVRAPRRGRATGLDLRGRRLAFTWSSGGRSELRLGTRRLASTTSDRYASPALTSSAATAAVQRGGDLLSVDLRSRRRRTLPLTVPGRLIGAVPAARSVFVSSCGASSPGLPGCVVGEQRRP